MNKDAPGEVLFVLSSGECIWATPQAFKEHVQKLTFEYRLPKAFESYVCEFFEGVAKTLAVRESRNRPLAYAVECESIFPPWLVRILWFIVVVFLFYLLSLITNETHPGNR